MKPTWQSAETLKAPFPAFGGKSSVADDVWQRFGDVRNYVEPFAFSAAVLLRRPLPFSGVETINDINGYVANFWRAVQRDPEQVTEWADSPVNECDLMAWHLWLVERKETLAESLMSDPDYFDAKIAGKWCWGSCCWIGSGWCSGEGPWHRVQNDDGSWQLVHLGNAGPGLGVNRKRVHLGNAGPGLGVNRKRVHLGNAGLGVNRKLVHLGDAGRGVNCQRGTSGVYAWMQALADRLALVRVCCGDWSRVCGPTPTVGRGLTAVFLDPPYPSEDRADVYGHTEDRTVATDVYQWCLQWQDDPRMRIALCGYDGEHDLPGWERFAWKARGGYGLQAKNGNDNCNRERIWFSPKCLTPNDFPLFASEPHQTDLLGEPSP